MSEALRQIDLAIEALRRWQATAPAPDHLLIAVAYLETLRLNLMMAWRQRAGAR